jgi:threonine/homoserine/homoserine lactone efflux protein/glutathione S-transferase
MTFLPDMTTLLAYSLASILLFITPGPDMSLWLSRTIVSGRKAGWAAMAGTNLGCVVHTLLAAFGVSALIAASATAFTVLKIVGAAYLLWLAYDAIRNGSSLNVKSEGVTPASNISSFLLGITVNLTNPKVVLFFITFLPQFVSATDPNVTGKLLFLGLYFVVLNTPLAALLIWSAEKFVRWLKARPRVLRGVDYSFAAVFAFFALKIAFTLYGMSFEHRPWSTFGDADKLRVFNPLGRVPTLVLDDGTSLLESAAILDYLDSQMPADKVRMPRHEPERHLALRRASLACGLADKAVSMFYERRMHSEPSPIWLKRCKEQIIGALAALEAERAKLKINYWFETDCGHADIAEVCALRFLGEAHPGLIDMAKYPALSAHAAMLEAMPIFKQISQPFMPPK